MAEISPALYRAGEGEQLVLLHGFTGAWHHWRPLLAELVARFEVIAPTLAGHDGGPEYPAEQGSDLRGAADLLERQLDELGVGVAHLVGNSMGGSLAIELARRGRASSVVALSPGAGWERGSREPQRIMRMFTRQRRLLRGAERRLPAVMATPRRRHIALREVMTRGELMSPYEAVAIGRSSLRCEVFARVMEALASGDDALPLDLGEIDVPVLLAWAQHDRILPAESCSARYRREIPGAEFRILPRVGHVPMWDARERIAATIVDWVARHAAVPAGG